MRNISKCPNTSMKCLYRINENGNIIEIYLYRETIEKEIISYNKQHYKKVLEMKTFNNKIYQKLQDNNTRDKILAGNMRVEDYNNNKVFEFLSLLKQNSLNGYLPFEPIMINE